MGGNILAEPGSIAWKDEQRTLSIQEVADSAVDSFDAAARLESQGYGDAAARGLGYVNVFEMAGHLVQQAPRVLGPTNTVRVRTLFVGALGRMLVLFAGVALCISTLPPAASTTLMFVAGACGWIWTQVLSSEVWRGLGTGRRDYAASIALTSIPALVFIAILVSWLLNSPGPLLWALWGLTTSVLLVLRPGATLVLLSLFGASVALFASWLSPSAGMILASGIIVVAFADALVILRLEGGKFIRLSRAPLIAGLLGMLQACGQLTVFLVLLLLLGVNDFPVVAISALLAAALSDPILEVAHNGVRQAAGTATSWVNGRMQAAWWGIGGVLAIIVVTTAASLAVQYWFHVTPFSFTLILATLLVAGITAGVGLLLRTGSSFGATTLAVVAGFAVAAVVGFRAELVLSPLWLLSIMAVISLGLATVIAAKQMSRPQAW